jgi:small subunit ribosomal protein S21
VSNNHFKSSFEGKKGLTVEVRGGNVEGAIRLLSRRIKQEGIMRELRARTFYEKPSTKKRRKHAEAVSRWRKAQSKLDQ